MALVYFKDRRYQESYELYKKLYDEGDEKLNVLLPLIELNLLFGDTKGAVELMEKVLKENPNLPRGRAWLGELYKYDSRPGDYLANLEKIVEENPNQEQVKELIDLYDEFGQTEKMIKAYEKLVAMGNRDEKILYALAFLKANEQKLEEAIEVLSLNKVEMYRERDTLQLYINVLLDQGAEQQAFELTKRYLRKNPDVQTAILLSNVFFDYGYPQDAYALIEPFEDQVTQDPELFSAFVMYGQQVGKKDKIYKMLNNLFKSGALPNVVLDSFIQLAILEKDSQTLDRVLHEVDPNQFSEEILITLIDYVTLNKQEGILNYLKEMIPPARIDQSNVLKLAFFLAENPSVEDFNRYFINVLDERELTVQEKFEIEEILFNMNRLEQAKTVYNSINTLEGLSSIEIEAFALMGIQLKEEEKAKALVIEQLQREQGTTFEVVGNALLYLQSASGQTEAVIDTVENLSGWNQTLVEDLFYIALGAKNKELTLYLGKLWYDVDPSVKARQAFVSALILNEQFEEALPLLEKLVQQNPGLYDLIQPYLLTLAKTTKDEAGKVALENYLKRVLQDPNIPADTKAIWGYVFMEEKEKQLAEIVFYSLVSDKDFKEEYLQTLLALWGENPNERQIDWLVEKARNTSADVKVDLIYYLIGIEQPELIQELITKEDLKNYKIAYTYLESLIALQEKELFEELWCEIAAPQESVEEMMKLAELALDFTALEEAAFMFQRVLEKDPKHEEAFKKLAYTAYLLGWYPYSFSLLEKYLMKCPKDYLGYYYYAQILFAYGFKEESYIFFQETLRQVRALETQDNESKLIHADTLFKLQKRHASLREFMTLLNRDPKNLSFAFEAAIHLEAAKYYQVSLDLMNCYVSTLAKDLVIYDKDQWQILYAIYLEKVRVLRSMWRTYEAKALLDDIYCFLEFFHEKENFWISVSEFENQLGQWRAAMDSLGVAQQYAPYDCGLGEISLDIWDPYRPYIQPEMRVIQTNTNQTEHRYKFEYFTRYQEKWSLLTWVELDNATATLVQRPSDGAQFSFRGMRYRSSCALGLDCHNGDKGLFGIFVGNEVLGVQAGYTKKDARGETSLLAWYHYPTWDVIETIAYMGAIDQLQLGRVYHFNQFFRYEGTSALRFWSINHRSEVAKSINLSWNFILSFSNALAQSFLGDSGFIDFIYLIDAEYVFDRKKIVDPAGDRIPVLNILTQETHSFIMITQYDFSRQMQSNNLWEVESFIGYSYNRFGKGGPAYGLSFNFQKPRGYQIFMNYLHSVSTTTPGQTDEFTFRVRYPF